MRQAGGEMPNNVYVGRVFQKGSGLGGMFKKFFRWIVPLVKKHALPVLKKGASAVGDEVFSSTVNLAKDIISGKNVQPAMTERFEETVDNLKRRAEDTLEGRGIKGVKNMSKTIILKKRKKNKKQTNDIFN